MQPTIRSLAGRIRLTASRLAIAWLVAAGSHAIGIETPSPMLTDPYFEPLPLAPTLPDGTLELWNDAMVQGGAYGCREACAALIRAQRLGIDVRQQSLPALAAVLQRQDSDPIALRAASVAAVELDLRELAPRLASILDAGDRELERIVEPALARWQYAPMMAIWRARLADDSADLQRRLRAYQGLGLLRDHQSAGSLLIVARAPRRGFALRLSTAEALGLMPSDETIEAAAELANGSPEDCRIAAVLLSTAGGEQVVSILAGLAAGNDSVAAARALERLIQVDPPRSLIPAQHWSQHGNARLRLLAIDAFAANRSASAVAAAGTLLADVHPQVRRSAADLLARWGETGPLRADVEQQIIKYLSTASPPRAAEQAALLAATIRRDDSIPALVELLQHEADFVAVAAAWALGQLADPQTGPAVMEEVRRETARTEQIVAELTPIYAASPEPGVEIPKLAGSYDKVEQLILALGRMRYREAAEMLSAYVPKPTPQVRGQPPSLETYKQDRPRAAAIWALGHLLANEPRATSPQLVARLTARMADTTPIPAEAHLVRQMAAVALGRMGRMETLESIKAHFDPTAAHTDVGRACGWAIGQLTGDEPPRQTTQPMRHVDWFLIPLGN